MDASSSILRNVAAIVPAYNRAAVLPETLRSLCAQTRPFDRIIVVDDGSTDATAEVAQGFAAVTVIRQSRGRVQAARNRGAAASEAEWLLFCDSDDLLDPGYLEAAAALLRRAPDLACIAVDHLSFEDDRTVLDSRFAQAPADFWAEAEVDETALLYRSAEARRALLRRIVDFDPIWPTGMLVRHDIYRSIGGFDTSIAGIRGEDWEFKFRLLQAAPTGLLRSPRARIRARQPNDLIDPLMQILGEAALRRYRRDVPGGCDAPLRAALTETIISRWRQAVWLAFPRGDVALLRDLSSMLEGVALRPSERLRLAIAALPTPLAGFLMRLLAFTTPHHSTRKFGARRYALDGRTRDAAMPNVATDVGASGYADRRFQQPPPSHDTVGAKPFAEAG